MTTSDDSVGERISIVVQGVDVAGDYASAAAAVGAAREELSGLDGVASVADAFALPDPASQQARAMLSTGGDGYVEVVTLDAGLSDKEIDAANERVVRAAEGAYLDSLRQYAPEARVYAVSPELIGDSIGEVVQQDLARGESVSLPVAMQRERLRTEPD